MLSCSRKSARGFSLIELLIVVAIILIIAAIAIPNFMRSRIAANQASAVGSLRQYNTAEVTYASTFNIGYTVALSYLGPVIAGQPTSLGAGLVDSLLASGVKSGYVFVYSSSVADPDGKVNAYQITATPTGSASGTIYYFTDQSGVIRQNATAVAGSTDSPIAG